MSTDPAQPALFEGRWRHPWAWMSAALGATATAFVWVRVFGPQVKDVSMKDVSILEGPAVPLVGFGVIAAGMAVGRRCTSPLQTAYLDQLDRRKAALLGLAAVHTLIALAVSALLVARFAGADLPGDTGGSILLWLLAAPWCAWSARALALHATDGRPLPARLETAVLLTQAGLAALLGSWALYWGADPELRNYWDSVRLFLGVAAAVAFLAAPLVAAPQPLRRLGVSVLIVLHFVAILSVVLGSPPGPFLAQEAHHWLFRPYIDFMYLNNAYRFYSPEPSASSQLWLRVEYEQPGKKEVVSRWIRLPEVDAVGTPQYFSNVQFTRRLALTENVARAEPMPPLAIFTADGRLKRSPFTEARIRHLPLDPQQRDLGQESLDPAIPMHPDPGVQNYQKPLPAGRQLLASFARHVLGQPPPKEYPNARPVRVKMYRVLHRLVSAEAMAKGIDPHNWELLVPYYMGMYDRDGNLLDAYDPFLYWALPMLPDPHNPKMMRCYIYLHSGDPQEFLKATSQ
jgi:hypothetical protein